MNRYRERRKQERTAALVGRSAFSLFAAPRRCLFALAWLLVHHVVVAEPQDLRSDGETLESPANQTDVAVTVYNNDQALVRDTRTFRLAVGEQELRFPEVASHIRPQTVNLKSISAPGSIQIIEQNYEFDLISPSKLMEKYVGKKVKLQNFRNDVNTGMVEGELLSVNERPVYRVADEIYLGFPGTVVLPEVPENLIARPSLLWLLNNEQSDQTLEVSYLTGGMSWKADYVLTLSKDEKSMGIEGWVTLSNQSGVQYTNAQLKLVAGDINIVTPRQIYLGQRLDYFKREADGGGVGMKQEAFAEYHLYTLPRRTTIRNNQSKQVRMLGAEGVGVSKLYEYRGNESYYSQKLPPIGEEKVAVFLLFKNAEENRLGMPLPAGTMRIYLEDNEGMKQFAGEDGIKHTPKDEEVKLRLGHAFDVVAERTQTDFRVVSDNVFQSAYEIRVRNHKDGDVAVDIVEPMPGDWAIIEKSQDFAKKDARTAVFSVLVPEDGEAVVTYRVQVTVGGPQPLPRPQAGPRTRRAPTAVAPPAAR